MAGGREAPRRLVPRVSSLLRRRGAVTRSRRFRRRARTPRGRSTRGSRGDCRFVEAAANRYTSPTGDAEIRIATEPSRPVQSAVLGVATTAEIHLETTENPEDWPDDLPRTVWLCAGDRCADPDAPSEAYRIASYVS